MKRTNFTYVLVIGFALSLAAVGCKHHPTPLTPIPEGAAGGNADLSEGGTVSGGEGMGSETTAIAANPPGSHAGWHEDAEALKSESVYFAYDMSVIRPSEQSKVQAVADYLKNNPAAAVRVEGNCDERGTEEYNRALGERRALAAREELVSLGIDPKRVDTISYGKDRPIDTGNSEAAHARNRRDDFVVLTHP